MRLNIERSFTAPFTSLGEGSLLNIYLIAGGITFGVFVIQFILSTAPQLLIPLFSFNYGSTPDPSIITLLISGFIIIFLVFITIICAIQALPLGYVLETAKLEVCDKSSIMPPWNGNLVKFFVNGLKLMAILFLYYFIILLAVAIPFLLTLSVAFLVKNLNSDLSALIGIIGGFISFILAIFLLLAFLITLPMICIRFIVEDRFWAAFNVITIWKKIISNFFEYIIALIVTLILFCSLTVIPLILCCTVIGILVIPLISNFIIPIIILNMFAQIYKGEPHAHNSKS